VQPHDFTRHLGGHIGITVAVTADPRTECQWEAAGGVSSAPWASDLVGQISREVGHRLVGESLQVIDEVASLIDGTRSVLAQFIGLPDQSRSSRPGPGLAWARARGLGLGRNREDVGYGGAIWSRLSAGSPRSGGPREHGTDGQGSLAPPSMLLVPRTGRRRRSKLVNQPLVHPGGARRPANPVHLLGHVGQQEVRRGRLGRSAAAVSSGRPASTARASSRGRCRGSRASGASLLSFRQRSNLLDQFKEFVAALAQPVRPRAEPPLDAHRPAKRTVVVSHRARSSPRSARPTRLLRLVRAPRRVQSPAHCRR